MRLWKIQEQSSVGIVKNYSERYFTIHRKTPDYTWSYFFTEHIWTSAFWRNVIKVALLFNGY